MLCVLVLYLWRKTPSVIHLTGSLCTPSTQYSSNVHTYVRAFCRNGSTAASIVPLAMRITCTTSVVFAPRGQYPIALPQPYSGSFSNVQQCKEAEPHLHAQFSPCCHRLTFAPKVIWQDEGTMATTEDSLFEHPSILPLYVLRTGLYSGSGLLPSSLTCSEVPCILEIPILSTTYRCRLLKAPQNGPSEK
jgi:hypothetical protein